MRFGGRLAAAIEIVGDIEARRRPVAEALKDWGLSHRFAGSGDRAAIGNLVYDALRWRLSSAAAMGAETPRALVLGAVLRHWDLSAEALAARLADDPHAPEPPTDDEARGAAADIAGAPGHVRADIPEWLAPSFEAAFGGDWVAEAMALAARPPLDLRANTLKSDRDKVLKALGRFGAEAAPFAPAGLRIPATSGEGRHPNVQVEPAFQKGWFEIQDEGSQLAALLSGAASGEQVLDLCCGAGGKTLALSALMANKGQIHATDADRTRLAPIFDRLKRAGTRNVQVRPAGASLEDLAGKLDLVLVDAPCTGTGTWRRRPELKWRFSEKSVAERVAEQAALLAEAARYVKPGGRLVYVTCSLLPEENAARIEAFLAGNPAFSALDGVGLIAGAALPDGTKAALAGAAHPRPEGVMLTPRLTGTDGFFVAVLCKA